MTEAGLRGRIVTRFCIAAALCCCALEPALAQAKNPFSVGISEGGGSTTGVTGWILAQQGWFEHQLSLGVRAAKLDGRAFWPLVSLSFVYGVFHAAGPGHGKAVLASYMVANERALKRGVVLSFLAALLQGLVAIALVGVLALVLHATAQRMKDAASLVETASFAAIAGLGTLLVWRKGRSLLRLWAPRMPDYLTRHAFDPGLLFATASRLASPGVGALSMPAAGASRFTCLPGEAAHPANCVHCHAADPSTLMGSRFSLKDALMTVLAAGLRPCSGAILVLVFSISQGILTAGILSVLAMSVGVALTTACLASTAVLVKGLARRLLGVGSRRAALLSAGVEFGAACCVLVVGVMLLIGYSVAGS